MNIAILGAAGFIGTNLALKLTEDMFNNITLVDSNEVFFNAHKRLGLRATYIISEFSENTNFDSLLEGQDIVFHLFSSSNPTKSNINIPYGLKENVLTSSLFLEACVRCGVKKVVFFSSGGSVYGSEVACPIPEDAPTRPITSYGVQKIAIENLLYLYHYIKGLDYRIIRLSNPYGPYQRPDGQLGAVTTFIYKALLGEPIRVYGDGSVVRDFIFIDDAITGVLNIVKGNEKLVNLGSGHGTSINQVLKEISTVLGDNLKIIYEQARPVDVPINYLDISRYTKLYGNPITTDFSDGIKKTAAFLEAKG
jgi:UDP-glucose 4-epimerase